jgi:methionine--tRNA ligase beta chain
MNTINFEEFKKVEIKIGKVISCEKVADADKLLKLEVDFGDFQRQIVSGIAESYSPEEIIGKSLPFVVNLEYRKFKGEESQGMLMAIDFNGKTVLLEPNSEVDSGTDVV